MKKREMLFGMSVAMSKEEAIHFKERLDPGEEYFLVKVSEHPRDRHLDRKERYVVVRPPKKGEWVPSAYRVFNERWGK